MDWAYNIQGGPTPWARAYQISADIDNAGIPLVEGVEASAGLDLPTTTDTTEMVGVAQDTATFLTAQQADGSSAERKVNVVFAAAGACFTIKISGGATENTAITPQTTITPSPDGLSLSIGDTATPDLDDGTLFSYSGTNAGQDRKITTSGATTTIVTVAFDNADEAGDEWLVLPFRPFDANGGRNVQLTTNLYQADGSVATSAGAAWVPIDLQLRTSGDDGASNAFMIAYPHDSVFTIAT